MRDTESVVAAFDQLVREAETPDNPVRRTLANATDDTFFRTYLDVAQKHGFDVSPESSDYLDLDIAFRRYRQHLMVELMGEA